MSRYDYRDPGTDPAYCDGLDWRNDVTRDSDPADQEAAGIDVPDFDAPEPPVDPAEHAAQDASAALATLIQQIAGAGMDQDFDRVMVLWKMAHQIEMKAASVVNVAAETIDRIIERRR